MVVRFYELYRLNPEGARELLLRKLAQNQGNISQTARQLQTTRRVVRKWRDRALQGDSLHDASRTPKQYVGQPLTLLEQIIIEERKETNFGRVSLQKHILQKWKREVGERMIRRVFRKHGLERQKRKRSTNGEQRVLYDLDKLFPFEQLQIDVKHVLDKHALPYETYLFLKRHGLPQFQWTCIDVKTKIRFLAWSHSCNATFGKQFLKLVLWWLRSMHVSHPIKIQLDNGKEFCAGSPNKLREWNEELAVFGAELSVIPPGLKYKQGYVERSHRMDDEYFYVPCGRKTRKIPRFLMNGFRWQTYYNISRPHHGRGMTGETPLQKLASCASLINTHVVFFPPLLLENLLNIPSSLTGPDLTSMYRKKQFLSGQTKNHLIRCSIFTK